MQSHYAVEQKNKVLFCDFLDVGMSSLEINVWANWVEFKDEPQNHYYSWRDLLKMKINRLKRGLFGRQETSNAECAWTKQREIFYRGMIVIKNKLLGKSLVH